MRVFSVEMLVKEEGAAVVEAALKRLKGEAAAVAAEMKVTTNAVTTTGKAMQTAATGTQIAGDRAAKAAIGFAAVGNSLARTGTLTADMGTRIVEAGSQISSMFGPTGLAVGALLGFGVAAATSFGKTATEAKKAAAEVQKAVRDMVLAGDVAAIDKRLRDVQQGILDITSGEFVGGLDDLRVEYDKLNRTIIDGADAARTSGRRRSMQEMNEVRDRIQRLRDLGAQIRQLEADEARLLRARELAPRFATRPAAAVAAPQPQVAGLPSAAGLPRSADVLAAVKRDFDDLLRVKIPEAVAPAISDLSGTIYGQLANGIASAVEGGIISGLQMALAAGNIGAGFKAMGQAIVQAMASAMVKVALAAIGFGKLLANIQRFMMANPLLAVASAVALLTLARSMGGGATTSGMGAVGGPGGLSYSPMGASAPSQQIVFGSTSATAAAGMTPRQAMNVTIIGPNDPSAQRAMQELMAKADSRGRLG